MYVSTLLVTRLSGSEFAYPLEEAAYFLLCHTDGFPLVITMLKVKQKMFSCYGEAVTVCSFTYSQ